MSAALCELDAPVTSTADHGFTNGLHNPREDHPRPGFRHGTDDGYVNHRCRCEACRAEARRARTRRSLATFPNPRIDATVSSRRLKVLAGEGWSNVALGAALGMPYEYVRYIRSLTSPTVWRATHQRISALYLSGQQPPRVCRHSVTWARKRGWPTRDDLDYGPATFVGPVIDDVAVQRALDGVPVPLSREERITAVLRGAQRFTPTEICRRLHMSGGRVRQILNQQEKAS